MWQSVSFTAASRDLDNYQPIDTGSGDSSRAYDAQVLRVFAQADHVSAEHTLEFVLVRANTVYAAFDVALAPNGRRASADNSSGLYVCDATADETTTSKLDLLGDWYESAQKNRGASGEQAGAVWMVGLKTLGAGASEVNVQLAWSAVT